VTASEARLAVTPGAARQLAALAAALASGCAGAGAGAADAPAEAGPAAALPSAQVHVRRKCTQFAQHANALGAPALELCCWAAQLWSCSTCKSLSYHEAATCGLSIHSIVNLAWLLC